MVAPFQNSIFILLRWWPAEQFCEFRTHKRQESQRATSLFILILKVVGLEHVIIGIVIRFVIA